MPGDEQLTLSAWDALDDDARRDCAEGVGERLPDGWTLTGLERFSLGDASHHIAMFKHLASKSAFALIPAGAVTLGWDRAPLDLSAETQEALVTAFEEAWGGGESLEDVIDDVITPSRTVTLTPFLLEVSPKPATDYLAEDIYDYEEPEGDDGPDDIYRAEIARVLATDGFRLPTSDEWEHACRAGSSSFFRWGSEWPPGDPLATDFESYKQANGFGLRFTSSPYQVECVEGDCFRDGDGGSSVCGGDPEPYVWHTLASAYAYPMERAEECLPETYEEAQVRRLFPLPD